MNLLCKSTVYAFPNRNPSIMAHLLLKIENITVERQRLLLKHHATSINARHLIIITHDIVIIFIIKDNERASKYLICQRVYIKKKVS